MAIDINYKPEFNEGTSGVIMGWWCDKCQASHSTPWCPHETYNEAWLNMNDGLDNYRAYEMCPHCGQLIKEKVK